MMPKALARTDVPCLHGKKDIKSPTAQRHTPRDAFPESFLTYTEQTLIVKTNAQHVGFISGENCKYRTVEGFNTWRKASDLGAELLQLGPGASFGEGEINCGQEARETSVVCLQDCEFLVIDKEDYSRTFQATFAASHCAARAIDIFKRSKYFSDVEANCPGMIQKLAQEVKFVVEAPGQVIFRQGDDPGHCYVIAKGSAGVLIYKGAALALDEEMPAGTRKRNKEKGQRPPTPRDEYDTAHLCTWTTQLRNSQKVLSLQEQWLKLEEETRLSKAAQLGSQEYAKELQRINEECEQREALALQAKKQLDEMDPTDAKASLKRAEESRATAIGLAQERKSKKTLAGRFLTSEKFSTFSLKDSQMGTEVFVLKQYSAFGELALKENIERAATIKCLEICELMVITKDSFNRHMGAITKKLKDLEAFVPGFAKFSYQRCGNAPAAFFEEKTFPQGHVFFYEGIYASDAVIYILRTGSVELRRFRKCEECPTYLLDDRPLDPLAWHSWCERPRTGVAGSTPGFHLQHPADANRGRAEAVPIMTARGLRLDVPPPGSSAGREVLWFELEKKDRFFCSLPAFPLLAPEPFTVVATTPLEVFSISASAIGQLPPKLIAGIKEHLMNAFQKRMRRLLESEQAESPTSAPDVLVIE